MFWAQDTVAPIANKHTEAHTRKVEDSLSHNKPHSKEEIRGRDIWKNKQWNSQNGYFVVSVQVTSLFSVVFMCSDGPQPQGCYATKCDDSQQVAWVTEWGNERNSAHPVVMTKNAWVQ